jgi:hypothetical protein
MGKKIIRQTTMFGAFRLKRSMLLRPEGKFGFIYLNRAGL